MKKAIIEDVVVDFDLPSIIFYVKADWPYVHTLRTNAIPYKDWAKYSCIAWLRQRGIKRPKLQDLAFNRARNDLSKHAKNGCWVISASLRKGEETMIKMYQGLDYDHDTKQ